MQLATPLHFEAPRFPGFADDTDEVEVTLLCTDVVSFTEMTERLGDAASLMVMRRVADTVREAARCYRGELLEIRGDAFLLAFASPADARRCAFRMMRSLVLEPGAHAGERVHLRTAIHTGTVVRDGGGYFGRALILAYRLLPRAAAGQIAVSSSAASRLPGRWQSRAASVGSFRPRGFRNDVQYLLIEGSPRRLFQRERDGHAVDRQLALSPVGIPCFESALGAG